MSDPAPKVDASPEPAGQAPSSAPPVGVTLQQVAQALGDQVTALDDHLRPADKACSLTRDLRLLQEQIEDLAGQAWALQWHHRLRPRTHTEIGPETASSAQAGADGHPNAGTPPKGPPTANPVLPETPHP